MGHGEIIYDLVDSTVEPFLQAFRLCSCFCVLVSYLLYSTTQAGKKILYVYI